MEVVHADIKNFLHRNIFPSRTVLVFPPFNGFRRFLIHKLIEDNFSSSEVAAFSIGQDINRRIVICYKGLIREATLGSHSQSSSNFNMLERDRPVKQKSTPAAAVYRPPAARLAESRKSTGTLPTLAKSSDTKRVRRPDQQVYVPRPKRASFGSELPRSRSHSSSRTSLESDSSDKTIKCSSSKNDVSKDTDDEGCKTTFFGKILEPNVPSSDKCLRDNTIGHNPSSKTNHEDELQDNSICLTRKGSSTSMEEIRQHNMDATTVLVQNAHEKIDLKKTSNQLECSSITEHYNFNKMEVDNPSECDTPDQTESAATQNEKENLVTSYKYNEMPSKKNGEPTVVLNPNKEKEIDESQETSSDLVSFKVDTMETISLSSGSVEEKSNGSSTLNESRSSGCSSDCESDDNLNIVEKEKCVNEERNSQEEKVVKKTPDLSTSDVFIISDTSSSCDSSEKTSTIPEKKIKTNKKETKTKKQVNKEKSETTILDSINKPKAIDPSEYDWETMYDESGECLVPSLMEELTNSVGKVRVTSVDNDYRPYQSIEERTSDGECVIEIYDFPAAFTTTDLFNVFAAYRNKNFQVKWVDDTHALGIFPSPLIADEVLACTLPFVKTRPLRLGIAESRHKARNLVLPALPAMERPKTCTALARRLVSGALGLRLPTTSQERERERAVLKEAREKRRLEAKQREAAWEGTLTSQNCI